MTVWSSDGEKLGRVVALHGSTFDMEKGFFFPRELSAEFDDIAEIRGSDIILSRTGPELRARAAQAPKPEAEAPAAESCAEPVVVAPVVVVPLAAEREPTERVVDIAPGQEVCVPLVEEELSVQKRVVEVGEVIIHKDVVTEERQITVPVSHEVVRVERVAVSGTPSESAFQEETITIPVHEEEVEIRKHAVVREEVRVIKEIEQTQETTTATVRVEVVDVQAEGECEVPEEKGQKS